MPLEAFTVLAVGGVAQEQEGDDLDGKFAVLVEAEWRVAPFGFLDVAGAAARWAGSAGWARGDPQGTQTHERRRHVRGVALAPLGVSGPECGKTTWEQKKNISTSETWNWDETAIIVNDENEENRKWLN